MLMPREKHESDDTLFCLGSEVVCDVSFFPSLLVLIKNSTSFLLAMDASYGRWVLELDVF